MVSRWVWVWLYVLSVSAVSPLWAQSAPTAPRGARTVVYHPRDLISLRAKVRYSTLIVLPDGEDVVEATCGDRDNWLINVRGGLVSVKSTQEGSETNLNVVTTSGQVYAFLLTEVSPDKTQDVDLTVYLEPDTLDISARAGTRPRFVPVEQIDDFRAQADLAREQARRATEAARTELESGIAAFRSSYPLSLRFAYRVALDTKPFWVRAMFHDDRRTFIQSSARELPALYEIKDGKPNLVNFEVQGGTYIISKVLDEGYLMIGTKRLGFRRMDEQ
jgi:type IV secretory pathway VirB9-like protein